MKRFKLIGADPTNYTEDNFIKIAPRLTYRLRNVAEAMPEPTILPQSELSERSKVSEYMQTNNGAVNLNGLKDSLN